MQRRQFLQLGILAMSANRCGLLVAQQPRECAFQLGGDVEWGFLAELGSIYTHEDRVYCETPIKNRGQKLMFPVFSPMQAAQAKLEAEKKNEQPTKYIAHDAEGRLILTTELSDAAKWVVIFDPDLTKKMKENHSTDRDDRIHAYWIHHAVGHKDNKYLSLAAEKETVTDEKRGYKVQRIILGPKKDESFVWNNDFSGK